MSGKPYYCSFCGKSQHEVVKLIAAPGAIFICNECTALCAQICISAESEKGVWFISRTNPESAADFAKAIAAELRRLPEEEAR